MDDKDIATLILNLEKAIVKDYGVALTEASNINLQNRINTLFDMGLTEHRDLFDLMYNKGWYQLKTIESNKISEEYNKLNGELNNID